MTLGDLQRALAAAVAELSDTDVADAIGALASAQARFTARLTAPAVPVGDNELVPADAIAATFGVPVSQIAEMARQGRIPSLLIGKYRRFALDQVRQALTEGSSSKTAALQPRKKRSNGAASLGAATAVLPPPGVGKAGVKHAD